MGRFDDDRIPPITELGTVTGTYSAGGLPINQLAAPTVSGSNSGSPICDVTVGSRDYPYSGIMNINGGTPIVGDTGEVGYLHSDQRGRRQPVFFGRQEFSGTGSSGGANIVNIPATGGWFNESSSDARGRTNLTSSIPVGTLDTWNLQEGSL